jgi:hypothetical protein
MCELLVIFGQFWGEPWYGKNASLMESLPTGLRDVELTGRHFLSIPGLVAPQRPLPTTVHVGYEPQCARRGQDQTQRMRANDALPFTTLLLAQPRAGIGVTDGNCHRPAGVICG